MANRQRERRTSATSVGGGPVLASGFSCELQPASAFAAHDAAEDAA